MNFIGRIEELLKSRKIQKSKMLGDLNLSVNSFTNWKNRGTIPSGDTLQRIADYFGVTVDYLLGNETKPPEVGDLEDVKVALFGGDAEVTPEMWEEVKQFARFLALKKQQEKK